MTDEVARVENDGLENGGVILFYVNCI